MFSARREKKFLVEYPIDIAYSSLLDTFPVKYYRMVEHNNNSHWVKVFDFSNRGFVLEIYLLEHSANATIIKFIADYPQAIADIGSGCEMAIYAVLEAYLKELEKKVKTDSDLTDLPGDTELVSAESFINPMKTKSDTKTIVLGYLLCFLSILLPILLVVFYDPEKILLFTLAPTAVICFSFAIAASTILQLKENPKSVSHGRVQICICGLILIVVGFFLHFSISLLGIIIPAIVFLYMRNRSKY